MGGWTCNMLCRILIIGLTGVFLLPACGIKWSAESFHALNLQQKPRGAKSQQQEFEQEFKKVMKKMAAELPYPELLYKFYERKGFQPVITSRFLPRIQLPVLLDHLVHVQRHGLDTGLFAPTQISNMLEKLNTGKTDNALEAYHNQIALELAVTASLIKYSLILQYGLISPQKVYSRYAVPTEKPDTSSILRVFEIQDLKNYLDSIQPKDKVYLALQKELLARQNTIEPDQHRDSIITLEINLERLRWKNRPLEEKFVMVNIPDFTLDVVQLDRSILHMKVCVGEPGRRQTPQLGSMIHSVQVNPVWNIPQSIARNEIFRQASQDPYYLANSNINVYHKGKLIDDPESIDWSSVNIADYTFQQQPGVENALGKIKFLFKNESSVYLHDTPVQTAFDKPERAISHGCVRVERPMELAYALFGDGAAFNQIKEAMALGRPRAKFIALPKKIPIRLSYYTAWADDQGKVRFCKDIYDLDQALYTVMKKISATNNPFKATMELKGNQKQ